MLNSPRTAGLALNLRPVYRTALHFLETVLKSHFDNVFQEIICSFHTDKAGVSDDIYTRFPSLLRIDLLKERCSEQSAARWGLACVIAALKTNGSHGVHAEIPVGDKNILEFYTKLGFFEVPLGSLQEGIVIMGRVIWEVTCLLWGGPGQPARRDGSHGLGPMRGHGEVPPRKWNWVGPLVCTVFR